MLGFLLAIQFLHKNKVAKLVQALAKHDFRERLFVHNRA